MGYVAVEAGEDIIRRAEQLFDKRRVEGDSSTLESDQVADQLGRLVGQVLSEGGLYAPELGALAIKQAQGDTTEASFLLRAYRSTLSRWDYSVAVDPAEMHTSRRVSPAYKDVPGGQVLGATKDYTQRLINFELDDSDPTDEWELPEGNPEKLRNVMAILRSEGLIAEPESTQIPKDEPVDTTREPVTFPVDRSAVLQELARGETGAVTALGYSALRGYGQVHPTLGEVRVGSLPVKIKHPYTGEPVTVTHIDVSETEAVVPVYAKRENPQFAFGYGLVFGRNERKVIGMAILDASIQLEGDEPAENAEFVLDVIDGIDSFGFMEHLKLPHYVTFASILDRIRAIKQNQSSSEELMAEASADD